LYVPSQEEAPLRIHDSKDQPLLTSAFLIPRWGGIVIKNPPKAATEEYRFTKKDLQPIMKIFISQLRSLIGIRDLEVNISKKFVSLSSLDQSTISDTQSIFFSNSPLVILSLLNLR
jgi:hypothetical protein